MSQYIHRVPGRIRVRSTAFRCRSERLRTAEQELTALAGVQEGRISRHAGSITIRYDTALLRQSEVLGVLEQIGCRGASHHSDDGARKLGEVFGKALVGAVVQKAVE